jgi:hypothetical protein
MARNTKGFYKEYFGDYHRLCLRWADGELFKLYDAEVPGNEAALVGMYATKEEALAVIKDLLGW